MQVQLETLGALERRLNITLPMADIDAQVAQRLQRVARTAKVQGFRPGKAPLKIVEQNYGAQVREDVLGEEVQKSFAKAIQEQKIDIAGYPRFEPFDNQTATGESFTFSAVFEVYPEVAVGDLSGQEIAKATCDVTEAEIDKTIDILRKQRTRFNHAERAAQAGDRVTIDFKGTIDGEAFAGGSADNYSFVLGEGQMLPEFETGVTGMSEGETKDVPLNFPEDYHGKDVAGKQAVFAITLKNVAEPQLPEVDADFAKNLGVADGDVAKMRDEISKNVTREAKRRLQARVKEGVMQALLDVTPIELPKSLIDMEIGRLMQQAREDMMQRGYGAQMKDMPLPRELFDKMLAAKNFQSGMQTLRQIEFALFDMLLHTEHDPATDFMPLLTQVRQEVAVLQPPAFSRTAHTFSHIFAGGYAAGYYSYKWAEVLSADAYAAFEETAGSDGLPSTETGRRYREAILEAGGSRPAMESFKAFRGREPSLDALLRHQGMAEELTA